MNDRDYIAERLEAGRHLIPDYMFDAVKRYCLHGISPGSFLSAVICNDLKEAFGRADEQNAAAMHGWVRFFYNYTPSGCWGSPENFREWMAYARKDIAA